MTCVKAAHSASNACNVNVEKDHDKDSNPALPGRVTNFRVEIACDPRRVSIYGMRAHLAIRIRAILIPASLRILVY